LRAYNKTRYKKILYSEGVTVIGGGSPGGADSGVMEVMASTSPSDDMSLPEIATFKGEIGLLDDTLRA
jgi:hypothetical protein